MGPGRRRPRHATGRTTAGAARPALVAAAAAVALLAALAAPAPVHAVRRGDGPG